MKKIERLSNHPFKHMCMTVGELPTSFVESMTYYEALCWLLKFLTTQVVPTVNNNSEVVEELQNFVEHYFDNLDVQEEIDNKLDEMAEEGRLQEIIGEYLRLSSLLSFDTVNDMKNGQNFIEGSRAETLGYHELNDGGSAKYRIRSVRNDDVVDEMFIIRLTENLVAELIENPRVNVKQLGVKGDGSDETIIIREAIESGRKLLFPAGEYGLSATINCTGEVDIEGEGSDTIFTSIASNLINPLLDFSQSNHVVARNLTTNNSGFKVYPNASDYNFTKLMREKFMVLENVVSNVKGLNISNKTSWQGKFICLPAPEHYDRDFYDAKYSRYAYQIFNHSGYNAIDIDNRHYDEDGNIATVSDNSGIGIVDGVKSSAPALFFDMHGERNSIGIKNRTATPAPNSGVRPDTTYEVAYNGHTAIGCSVYDDTNAQGVATIKLRDNQPSIKYYDAENNNAIYGHRAKSGAFETIANGLTRSKVRNDGWTEYMYPVKIGAVSSTGKPTIAFHTQYGGGTKDAHIFFNDNGLLKINYLDADTAQPNQSGYTVQMTLQGASSARPTSRLTNNWETIGMMYFDTTLGKPIWWTGTKWVDANGSQV